MHKLEVVYVCKWNNKTVKSSESPFCIPFPMGLESLWQVGFLSLLDFIDFFRHC